MAAPSKAPAKQSESPACLFDEQAGLILSLAPRLLLHALGQVGRHAYVYYEQTVHDSAAVRQHLSGGRLMPPSRRSSRRSLSGASVHVFGGAQAAFGVSADLSQEALIAAADHAGSRIHSHDGEVSSGPVPLPAMPLLKVIPDALDEITGKEKLFVLELAVEAAFCIDPEVVSVRADYHDRTRRSLILDTDGELIVRTEMLSGIRVEVNLVSGASGYAVMSVPGGFDRLQTGRPEQLAIQAIGNARYRETAVTLTPGRIPVVFAAGTAGSWLHETAGHLLEADVATHQATSIHWKPGDPVCPLPITVYDDPLLNNGRASMEFDDEGVPATRTTLIEDGNIAGFLTDRRMAARLDLPLTGNGRRQDFAHPPLPRMTNLVMTPGASSPEDLIASVQEGLYVRRASRGLLESEPGSFRLSVVDGVRIERGQLTTPVHDLVLEGTAASLFAGLEGVANDTRVDDAQNLCVKRGQVVPVSTATPTVLVRDLEVHG